MGEWWSLQQGEKEMKENKLKKRRKNSNLKLKNKIKGRLCQGFFFLQFCDVPIQGIIIHKRN
jgi:hypothetical protein